MSVSTSIYLTDISNRLRFGLKGAAAAAWLDSQGLTVPEGPNQWINDRYANVLRLGSQEFIVEYFQQHATLQTHLNQLTEKDVNGVYYVPRYDACWLIHGANTYELFSELCMLDLAAATSNHKVCMTQAAGINATLIQLNIENVSHFYLLCDGSYRHYMQRTLIDVAKSLGELVYSTE
jgi:sarcosine oxidase, subunit gamma